MKKIIIFWLLSLTYLIGQQIEVTFIVSDGINPQVELSAGVDPLATDSLDTNFGEEELPPLPPSGAFDARFILPDPSDGTISSLRDYRYGNVTPSNEGFSTIHLLSYQLGEGSSNLSFCWDTQGVSFRIQDNITGSILDTLITANGVGCFSTDLELTEVKITITYLVSPISPSLDVVPDTLLLGESVGSSGIVSINSNIIWTVSADQSWIDISEINGSDSASITVSANQTNPTTSNRSGLVTVSGNNLSQQVEIVQLASPAYLEVSPDTLTVGQDSTSPGVISVSSNISWEASTQSDWLKLIPTTGSNDDTVMVAALAENPSTTESRFDSAMVSGSDIFHIIIVEQSAADERLDVLPDSVALASASGSIVEVIVKSNIAWTVAENADWLSVSQTDGFGDTLLVFTTLSENPSGIETRETIVTISGGIFNEVVKVTQFPSGGYLSITPNNLTLEFMEGSSGEIFIESNSIWSSINSVTWLEVIPSSGLNNDTIRVEAKSTNISYEPRAAILTISGSGIIHKVDIVQEGFKDSIPPEIPTGFGGVKLDFVHGIYLFWNSNKEADLSHYNIYRSETSEFEPDSSSLIHSTIDSIYIDTEISEGEYFYKLSAVDLSGNESEYADAAVIVGVQNNETHPSDYSLEQNFPNPFNPTTRITYSIPSGSYVSLKVFDVLGREVSELVDEEQSVGYYKVEFDASGLTSGIYFYRIQAGDFVGTKKMVVMK